MIFDPRNELVIQFLHDEDWCVVAVCDGPMSAAPIVSTSSLEEAINYCLQSEPTSTVRICGPSWVQSGHPNPRFEPERVWGWWVSADEERYSGPCATREEALSEAEGERIGEHQNEDGTWVLRFHIMQAIESFPVLGEQLTVQTAIKAAFRDGVLAERSRQAEPSASAIERAKAVREKIASGFCLVDETIAAAITEAENAARASVTPDAAAIRRKTILECLACVTIPVNGTRTAKLLAIASAIRSLLDKPSGDAR